MSHDHPITDNYVHSREELLQIDQLDKQFSVEEISKTISYK